MVTSEHAEERGVNKDLRYISILVAIALVIGVYLILTTVLIAKDGVGYIERAQQLQTDPIKIIKAHPPGYPFLILIAHKLASLFVDGTSNQSWIYSAQSVTLLCRLLALIPLYFMGKLLVGSKNSFWALLILILLPYPAELGSDVLREWPYLLFLSTGFCLLLWAAKYGKWWAFGLVGLTAGLGYMIRPESAQLLLYGICWLTLCFLKPKFHEMHRWKSFTALALLFIGFAIPAAPYMKCKGEIIPGKIKSIMRTFSINCPQETMDQAAQLPLRQNNNTAEIISYNALKALGDIFKTIGESLMWFFIPMLFIGFWYHFKHNAKYEKQFLMASFISVNIAMMVLQYCYVLPHASQRWSLPLVTFTIFYIPIGLQVVEDWLNNKQLLSKQKNNIPKDKRLSWFLVLLLVGIAICLPKLFRPTRIEKQGYREIAEWLRTNTAAADIIAAPDRRIAFYAERKARVYTRKMLGVNYAVKKYKNEDELLAEKELSGAKKTFSCKYNNAGALAAIYDLRNYISERVSFVKYHCEKTGNEKYRFSFVFDVNNGFEKDWTIYFHGTVNEEHVAILPDNRKKYKFDNWGFSPKPPTSDWPPSGRVTITQEISAKPIPYEFSLGFYRPEEGIHGKPIRIGCVDMSNLKQSDDRQDVD
jgi:hypothetical protein